MPNEKSGSSGGGLRYNEGKLRYSLVSIPALTELVKVLEFGAKKYDSWNWSKGLSWTECYDSLDRHMKKWMSGEEKDPETGLSHMAHVMCNAMFLTHFITTGTGQDDRPAAQKNNKKTEGVVEPPNTFEEFIKHVERAAKRADDEQRAKFDPYAYQAKLSTGYGVPYNGIPATGTCIGGTSAGDCCYTGGCGAQNSVEPSGVSNVQANVLTAPVTAYWNDACSRYIGDLGD